MRSAFFGFHVASTGLFTARSMINVTSHNIANAEIPGFSRQVALARANNPLSLRDSRGMYGTGSQVTGITQIRDRFLDNKFCGQRAVHGRVQVQNTHLNFIETVFNQLPDAGVLRTFGDFFDRMSYLTTRAQDATFRTNVISGADGLADQIRHHASALQRQQADINREISDVVSIINSLGSQIATLNEQINIFERTGDRANDLRDQRALLIDELSHYVNVQVEERDFSNPPMNPHDRRTTVMINGYDFVNHDRFNRLELVARNNPHYERSGPSRNEMDVPGLYDIRFAGTRSPFNIYSPTLGGQLRGLIDVRDGNGGHQTVRIPVLGTQADFSPTNPNTWPQDFIDQIRMTSAPNTPGWPPGFNPSNHLTWSNAFFPAGVNPFRDEYGNPDPNGVFDPTNPLTWPEDADFFWPMDYSNPDTWPVGVRLVDSDGNPFTGNIDDPSGNYPLTRESRTNNFKGIPFYMNQLNHLVRTFAQALNEGRNATGDPIQGATGHIFGYNANGDNLSTMFFTFSDPQINNGNPADVASLRMWILADPVTGEALRNPDGSFQTTLPGAARPELVEVEFPPGSGDYVYRPPFLQDTMGNPQFILDMSGLNAFNFKMNPALTADGGQDLLAASSVQTTNIGEANNDVIHGFLAVGNDRTLFREGRLLDFVIATSNHLAVDNQQARNFRLSYEEITMQTHNHRLSIKGVDTNEEMMNLVRFQTLFTASSRLVNVLDSIYDTLINRLGNF